MRVDSNSHVYVTNFWSLIKGIFSPDREPHPCVEEIKYLQQPVILNAHILNGRKAAHVDENRRIRIVIENRFVFRQLTDLQWKWSISSEVASPMKLDSELINVPEGGILFICPEAPVSDRCYSKGKHWLHVQIYFEGEQIASEHFDLIDTNNQQEIFITDSHDIVNDTLSPFWKDRFCCINQTD